MTENHGQGDGSSLDRLAAALRTERGHEADVVRDHEVTREILQEIGEEIRSGESGLTWAVVAEVAGITAASLMRRAKSSSSNEARLADARERQRQLEASKLVGKHDPLTMVDAAALVGVARGTMDRWLKAGPDGNHGFTRNADRKVLPPAEGWPVPREGKLLGGDQPAIIREAARKLGVKRAEVVEMVERGELKMNEVGLVLPPEGGWPAGQKTSSGSEPDGS